MTPTLTPLPNNQVISTGMRLVHIPTNQAFTVICNCPGVQAAAHFRQRYVSQHPTLYAFPPTPTPPTPTPPTVLPSPEPAPPAAP